MDIESFINQSIDESFNQNNQLVEYVVSEMNQMNLNLTSEQAQHVINILEFVAKTSAKNGAIIAINALNELMKS